jgi:hypothetical protein
MISKHAPSTPDVAALHSHVELWHIWLGQQPENVVPVQPVANTDDQNVGDLQISAQQVQYIASFNSQQSECSASTAHSQH